MSIYPELVEEILGNNVMQESASSITDGSIHISLVEGNNLLIFAPGLYHVLDDNSAPIVKTFFIGIRSVAPSNFKYYHEEISISYPCLFGDKREVLTLGSMWASKEVLPKEWEVWVKKDVMLVPAFMNIPYVLVPRGFVIHNNKDNAGVYNSNMGIKEWLVESQRSGD